jgi:hemoglobin/transferrin/lactoferrin receptor protein
MKKTIAILACVFSVMGYAQTKKDTLNAIELDQIIVNSQRFPKQKRTISQQVESISKNEIEFQNSQNTADVFANLGVLAIQKSQQGGGSPVIRGFEASRILLVLDGVRMNNLIYRGGHLQNSITVDKNMLENIDVLFGPSSTIYGSDALGGAIFLQTKNAKLFSENGNKSFSGNFLTNYSSVNEGKSGHLDFNFGSEKWASLTSFSYNDYGDLKMGKQKNGSNDFFGERPFYTETINGVDTKVANDDKYVQKFSGYKQYDFMQKIVFQPSATTRHSLNLQYSTTTDIPRYDRLTDPKGNNFKWATWNYGPQKRLLGAYKLSKQQLFSNTDLNLTLSYQNIEESRLTRKWGKSDLENRIEKVSVYAINSDFKTKIGNGDFIYGADLVYDDLKSSAFAKNILTGVESILDSRYPNGKNNTFSAEGFAYFNNKINEKSSYNASLRAGYKILKSQIVYNPLNLPYTEVNQKNITYSGAIGFVNNPTQNVKVALNLASAYRVPNIDDLSKIFESGTDGLIVPNNNLKPEKSVTADFSITLWEGNRFQIENTVFYTKLYDPILTDKFTFNGKSTIDYGGKSDNIILANQNQGSGSIYGISSSVKSYFTKSLLFYANLNATKGRVQNDKGEFPLDHIAPVYGKVGFRFENKFVNLDLNMNYSGNKSLTDYSKSGEDNLDYAVATGTPSWETYNFKAGISAIKNLTVFTGVENILDTQYRTFSSGINAGGRNVYVGAKYSL